MAETGGTCANCERKIGRLERAYAWEGHAVCFECRERLARANGQTDAEEKPRDDADEDAAGPGVEAGSRRGDEVEAEEEAGDEGGSGGEVTHWSASPTVIGHLPLYAVSCGVAVAAVGAAVWVEVWQLALMAPVFLGFIAEQEFVRRSVRYSIVGRRLIVDRGIVRRSHHEIWAPDIRELTNDQTVLGRILGYGTVTADTAAHEEGEIRMENIPSPGRVVKLLSSLR
jgi:hypothetical protein